MDDNEDLGVAMFYYLLSFAEETSLLDIEKFTLFVVGL